MSESRPVGFAELWTIISLVVGVLSGVGFLVLRDIDHRVEGLTGRLGVVSGFKDDCKVMDKAVIDLLRAEYQGTTGALLQQLQNHNEKLAAFKGFMDSEIAMHADCAAQRSEIALKISDLVNQVKQNEAAIRRLHGDNHINRNVRE